MKRFLKTKSILFSLLALLVCASLAYAITVSVRPGGIAFPYWYSYTAGVKSTYYLTHPTLTANEEVMSLTASQTATNKTLTSPTIATPTITGGTVTDATFLDLSPTELTASGPIAVNVSHVELNSTTPLIAATIAAPAAGWLLFITQTDAGTAGHTVTLTAGTWDGTNPIVTFNAQFDTLVVWGLSATRFIIFENIGAVAFSGA